MAKAEFKIKGLKELQEKLRQAKSQVDAALNIKLLYLGEECQTHAKQHKGYRDHTSNLKNSISFALYKDGQPVQMNIGDVLPDAQAECNENVKAFFQENVVPQGYTLMIVAGMNYGIHVEHKGYNVLYSTRFFMIDELKKVIEETVKEAMNGDYDRD